MVLVADRRNNRLAITGNTWDIKGILKNNGGVWDPSIKGWTFRSQHEEEVMQALRREKLVVEDRRPPGPPPPSVEERGKASRDLVVLNAKTESVTPASARKRARSKTPPRPVPKSHPDVKLNQRTVRDRVADLMTAAGDAATVDLAEASLDELRAQRLVAELQAAAAEAAAATEASILTAATSRAQAAFAQADNLSAEALEQGGLVKEAARLAFFRNSSCNGGSAAAALRQTAKRAQKRWLARRAEAASAAEAAKAPAATAAQAAGA
eukprot:TRINITY_DN76203_c0_g1_i1.p1 TRINITY_DN76203_c0_g1~~TRINITY_DN76203_c0_g1_i1.p1  ORF type:complete len:267 (+),score=74.00 TRINITY_DN76203_c0_g1_i1:35-835(+)